MITNAGLNLIRDALEGSVTDCEITFVAWGDDDTAPALTDTILGNELGRHAVTSQVSGGAGILTTIVYLAPADAVADIKEIGFFADVAGTVLVSRKLYAKNKTVLFSLQLNLKDTIREG